ncbi:MAG: MFS transporter [Gammaproteobacteria bacterium]|nr:MFS transporter [Gammaproteobacteria bacterium]
MTSNIAANVEGGRRVPASTKVYFGIGGAAEGALNWVVAAATFLVYTVVFGLPGTLAGLATSIPIILDGITDPLIGHLSDRWRSRLGRRHPFIYLASIPVGLFAFAIYLPPSSLILPSPESLVILGYEAKINQWLLALWLLVTSSLLKVFLTFYTLPHLALGAELSTSYVERTRIFRYNTFFSYTGGAILSLCFYNLVIPGGAQFGVDTSWFALGLGIFSAVAIFLTAHLTRDQIPHLSQPPDDQPVFSFRTFVKESLSVFQNRNYRMLFFGLLALSATLGIRETLGAHMGLYFWELEPAWLGLFPLPAIAAYILCMSIVAKLNERFEKGSMMGVVISLAVFAAAFPILARFAGYFPANGSLELFATLCFFVALFYGSASILTATVFSAIGDVVDEHELETGRRQEGVFYAVRTLFSKVSIGFGHLLAGIAIDIIEFPANPVAGEIDPQIIFELGLFEGVIATIPAYFAIYFYSRYKIDRKRHAEIRRGLAERAGS